MASREWWLLGAGVLGVGGLVLMRKADNATADGEADGATADLIKQLEGCRLEAYQDVAGIWTIGFGQTGPGIGPGVVWTQAQCDAALENYLSSLDGTLDALIAVPLSTEQRAAVASLAYNIGTSAFAQSTLLRKLNAGDYQGAAEQFLVWNRAGGSVVTGLALRRAAERALFLQGVA